MSLVITEKRCPDCGEVKPLDDFHRDARRKDGRHTYCKPCSIARAKASAEKRRAAMGEDAWRDHAAAVVRRSRARTGNASGKRYAAARYRALETLRERHQREFDALLRVELYEATRPETMPDDHA